MKTLMANIVAALGLIAVSGAFTPADADAPPAYQITDLGTLPGEGLSEAVAINDRAQIVGICSAGGQGRAFLWEKGKMQPLPVLPGFGPLSLWPCAINNQGTIIGTDFGPNLDTRRAFVYRHGVIQDLGTPPGEYSEAAGINDRNQIVGTSYSVVVKNGGQHLIDNPYSFLWNPATGLHKLSLRDNNWGGGVSAINNAGQIVGASMTLGVANTKSKRDTLPPQKRLSEGNIFPYAATIWRNGKMKSIAPPQAWNSSCIAINEQGDILGSMSLYPEANESFTTRLKQLEGIQTAMRHSLRYFLWHHGQVQDLGEMDLQTGGAARAFNNRREIVGSVELDNGLETRAFLWREGKQYLLADFISPAAGWVLREAMAINNHGQIVGVGLHNGKHRAFLLTPR